MRTADSRQFATSGVSNQTGNTPGVSGSNSLLSGLGGRVHEPSSSALLNSIGGYERPAMNGFTVRPGSIGSSVGSIGSTKTPPGLSNYSGGMNTNVAYQRMRVENRNLNDEMMHFRPQQPGHYSARGARPPNFRFQDVQNRHLVPVCYIGLF